MQSTVNSSNVASSYMRRVAKEAPMLSAAVERDLVDRFQAGAAGALQELLVSHLRLVLAIAQKYAAYGVSIEDLVSEGNLGLVEAARRFDAERGTRFATYAAWWIRAYIRRYTITNRRIVAAPSTRNARKLLAGLRKTERELAQNMGEPAERGDIAEALGVTTEDVAMVEAALTARDVAIGPDDHGGTYDVADDGPSPEQRAADTEARSQNAARVQKALLELDAREREIVRRRMLDDDAATLATLGERLGLSRERVRQIEMRAQRKLRAALSDCVM